MGLEVFYTDRKTFDSYIDNASGEFFIPVLIYCGRYGHLKINDSITLFTSSNDEASAQITAINQEGKNMTISFRVTHKIVR